MLHYPKSIVRPVRENDLSALLVLAESAGKGMTNLPKSEQALEEKIATSLESFSNVNDPNHIPGYFFVIEELENNKIVGCSAIAGAGSHMMPFYHFKMSTVEYVSQDLNLKKTHKILNMVNDYQGCTEICSLFLLPQYRVHHNGSLLSRSRFLFMAEHSERFNKTIIAEMRGVVHDDGSQPFWDNVISNFIDMPYIDADRLTGIGVKQFISDMMPRYPIYVVMLPDAAQAVIDKVHKDTEPALAMLEREGFKSHGYIDIFEAGTMVECELKRIKTVRKSYKHKVDKIVANLNFSNEKSKKDKTDNLYLISTTSLDFRVCIGELFYDKDNDELSINEEVASLLNVNKNNHIRYVPLKFAEKKPHNSK
jgi:arginine N-succinyltransferase